MKKIICCLLVIGLFVSSMSISYATSENSLGNGNQNRINSVHELEKELKNSNTKAEALEILALADDEVVTEFYQELNSKTMRLVEKIPSDICYREQSELANIANSINGIEKINAYAYCVGDDTVNVEKITLEGGTSVTITVIDGSEAVQSTKVRNSDDELISPASVTGATKLMRKDVGDRYTQINCLVEYALYPDTLLKTRIGYTVNDNNTIAGRYIKGYEDSATSIANEVTNTPTDNGWVKKAANSSYVKAYQNVIGNFSIKGINVLKYEYKVMMTATPKEWGKGYAIMEVTTDVTTKLK